MIVTRTYEDGLVSQEQAIQFLQQGIAAARAKQNEEARRLLQNAIRLDPANETAWLWLSSVARDNKERVFCLRQLLQINPQNEMAIKGLKALGVSVGDTPEEAAAPRSAIPQPAADRITAARATLDPIIQRVLTRPDPYADIRWVHKERNRAGERAATLFNITIRVVPILVLLCIIGAAAAYISQNPNAIALAPTWTPSPTPTVTPTPTPGFTPTPSPTPALTYTPTPPIDPALPHGDLFAGMTITPEYPRFEEGRILEEAVILLNNNRDSQALPTLSALRQTLLEGSTSANPYYYEAVALTDLGDTERAERVLQEGLTKLEDLNANTSLLHAGLAYVYAAEGNLAASNEEADRALAGDPRLPQPYYLLAQNAITRGNYQAAADVIQEGLEQHPADVYLWIQLGKLNLARQQPAEAQQNARVALYIDPTAEEAYLLQAEADMAIGDYGLSVLHLQDFLFTYPGSIEGWTMLGDARAREGNFDLAIDAYSRAVNTSEKERSQIPALMSRAALYNQRHQYARAYSDFNTVLNIDNAYVPAREGRALAAYRSGRFGEAVEDVDLLLEQFPDRDDLRLLKARALVDGANPRNETAYQQALENALQILSGAFPGRLDSALQPLAYEYRARILLEQENARNALTDVDAALTRQESGYRHYLRGRIQEALNNEDEARKEFEWVRLWGQVFSYPFLPDAITRLQALQAQP